MLATSVLDLPSGAWYCPPPRTLRVGAGSARRSSFPLGVSGRPFQHHEPPGTMYSGSTTLQILPAALRLPPRCSSADTVTYATSASLPGHPLAPPPPLP